LYAYFIEPYWIDIKKITIPTDKLQHTSLTIVQISDTHCDNRVRNEYKLVDIINQLKPDLVVFTGDSVNLDMHTGMRTFKHFMNKLDARLGKFAVKGNIDWYWRNTDLFADTGFRLLAKESIALTKHGETFIVSGLSYEYLNLYSKTLKDIPPNRFSILLCHTPDLIEDVKKRNVDLYLAGHTHGGQVALPLYGALITLSRHGKKYEAGKYTVGDTILYVNRGVGMEGGIFPRIRFFARPEITVFTIKPKVKDTKR
jgi:predicted MPP superfamily phosphohydrolase